MFDKNLATLSADKLNQALFLLGEAGPVLPMPLSSRVALASVQGFRDLNTDSDGRPCVWGMTYDCECGEVWEDTHSCACDDRCPKCGVAVEPALIVWVGPDVPMLRELWETLPEDQA